MAGGTARAGTKEADLAGRWLGSKSELSRSKACAEGEACNALTLDVSRCGEGWCGVEVLSSGKCGATALKFALTTVKELPSPSYRGTLSLAKSTEPYVVEVAFQVYSIGTEPEEPHLSIIGDTGGEFHMFRRTFPFHSILSKTGPAVCLPEKALSMLE